MSSPFLLQSNRAEPRLEARRILLVEDDLGDAVLVQALLEEADENWEIAWVPSLEKAADELSTPTDCVLVDLGLPDAHELEALTTVLASADGAAVIVLTGLDDERRGLEAVAAGAQDYLVKGAIDSSQLTRAIRYAVERKQAEETQRRLRDANLQRRENERLERGLLPKPLVQTKTLDLVTRYRPGGGRIQLGGDFFDVVEAEAGRIRFIIGDVSGHGPDEAAIGVVLRAAWRALVLVGHPPEFVLGSLQTLLESERNHDELYVTCCDVVIDLQSQTASMRVAGHPLPVLLSDGNPTIVEGEIGPALGLLDQAQWPELKIDLGPSWGLLLFTDGVLEGHLKDGDPRDRLGVEGLVEIIERIQPAISTYRSLVDEMLVAVEAQNGAPLSDDMAVLLLSDRSGR